jgi:hypothetical protein
MICDDERGALGGMIGRGNRSTGRNPTPVSLCPPQIPHNLARALIRAVAVGSQPELQQVRIMIGSPMSVTQGIEPVKQGADRQHLYRSPRNLLELII